MVTISTGRNAGQPTHEYVHCAAAKAGVDALTVGLAKELAEEGIRGNAVAPGTVRTEIHAGAGDPHRADRVTSRSGVPANGGDQRCHQVVRRPPMSVVACSGSPGPLAGEG
ncbi:MAG TPA: SDR family oxidoreductase [Jiangellaceae bacterium]|nr:SDR family oxidoreductase [Jiangellaceae bacterium]